jgi:hypothetical protein
LNKYSTANIAHGVGGSGDGNAMHVERKEQEKNMFDV